MNTDLVIVFVLLVAAVAMFAIGRPRMDVVAVLIIVALPLTGILSITETLAGFADPNVVLIAALFVVGEGLSRTGVTFRLGDALARTAGTSSSRLIVLLMLSVALLGAVMSSTGVVAIFIPVALSIAARTGMSPRQLMMPISFAGLISGMLTLIATTPNLIVDAELIRSGNEGFGFFTITPIGVVILALGIGYQLLARGLLGDSPAQRVARRTFESLLTDYRVNVRIRRYRLDRRSPFVGKKLAEIDLGGPGTRVLMAERTRLFQRAVRTTADEAELRRGDVLFVNAELPESDLKRLDLKVLEPTETFFETNSSQIGLAEILVGADSDAVGKSVSELRLQETHDLVVLGMRHAGRTVVSDPMTTRLAVGDTLLASGAWKNLKESRTSRRGLIVLDFPAEVDEVAPAANQAPFAIVSVLVMVLLMVTGLVPNVIAALIACLLLGLFRCVDMPSAYRAIHWPTILLIVGMLPFAEALQKTGGVDLVVDALLLALGDAGPTVLLGGIFVLTALIGLFVSNTATAVLMAPIAISTAAHLGVSPLPFAMIVAVAASSAFMTPVSSPVNTLVVEPGRYRFGDFMKVGAPFTGVVLIVSVLLVPVVLPL